MVKQQHWRIAGGIVILACTMMAIGGLRKDWAGSTLNAFITYWGIVVALLVAAVYCALVDLRYVRAQYAAAKREVFRETLGEESFRKDLRAAQQQNESSDSTEP